MHHHTANLHLCELNKNKKRCVAEAFAASPQYPRVSVPSFGCCRRVYKTDNFHSIVALVSCHNMFLMIMNHPLSVRFFSLCRLPFVPKYNFPLKWEMGLQKTYCRKWKWIFGSLPPFFPSRKINDFTGCTMQMYTFGRFGYMYAYHIWFSFWRFHNRICATQHTHSAIIQEGIERKDDEEKCERKN